MTPLDNQHRHRIVAWWTAGRTGLAKSDSAPNALHFTAPSEFGGLEGRWTPEDLLLAAVASCYTTTVRVVADYSEFCCTDIQVEVVGTVTKVESGYAFTSLVLKPQLTIETSDKSAKALRLLQKAHTLCLVTRALSVPITLEPEIHIGHFPNQDSNVSRSG